VRMRALVTVLLAMPITAMGLDLDALWDFDHPAVSEQRFTDALAKASPDEQAILQTQIARTFGLRGDFAKARQILSTLEVDLPRASAEVQARYHLELGRTYASAAHRLPLPTAEDRERARRAFLHAFDVAQRAGLDGIAIDALHMMVFVDTEPGQQLAWNVKAIAYVERSTRADAKRWEGPLRNNIGYAKHQQGDYEGALREFRLSRAAYERAGKEKSVRVADWMIAWTLRAQKKYREALAIQLRLERAFDAAGEPDPYVYEELEHLYRAMGNEQQADRYAAKLEAVRASAVR